MSSVDFSLARKGLIVVMVCVALLAITPWVGLWVFAGVYFVLPVIFVAHSLMAMAIIVTFVMRLLVRGAR